jgi:hypothetical protein
MSAKDFFHNTVFDGIGRSPQTKGLTEEILAKLLADES